MRTTRQVIEAINRANPRSEGEAALTEEQVRYALRSGNVGRPARIGSNYAWSDQEAGELARAFGLRGPAPDFIQDSDPGDEA